MAYSNAIDAHLLSISNITSILANKTEDRAESIEALKSFFQTKNRARIKTSKLVTFLQKKKAISDLTFHTYKLLNEGSVKINLCWMTHEIKKVFESLNKKKRSIFYLDVVKKCSSVKRNVFNLINPEIVTVKQKTDDRTWLSYLKSYMDGFIDSLSYDFTADETIIRVFESFIAYFTFNLITMRRVDSHIYYYFLDLLTKLNLQKLKIELENGKFLRYCRVYFYLGLTMHLIGLDFAGLLHQNDLNQNFLIDKDFQFLRQLSTLGTKKVLKFYLFMTKYAGNAVLKSVMRNVAAEELRDILATFSTAEIEAQGLGEYFSSKLMNKLISSYADIFYPVIQSAPKKALFFFQQGYIEKLQRIVSPPEMNDLEVENLHLGRIFDATELNSDGKNVSPFAELNEIVRKKMKSTKRKKYSKFQKKLRINLVLPGDIRTGFFSILTSNVLEYSLKMDKFITHFPRCGGKKKWRFAFPKVGNPYNPWIPKQQIWVGKMLPIKRNGAVLKDVIALLCFIDKEKYYRLGTRVELHSIRLFNTRSRRVIKIFEIDQKMFNFDDWFNSNCKISLDVNKYGSVMFRIFFKGGYEVFNLTNPIKKNLKLTTFKILDKVEKKVMGFIDYKNIVETCCSRSKFSIHLRNKEKDFMLILDSTKSGFFPPERMQTFLVGDSHQRLLVHYLVFDFYLILVFKKEIMLMNTKTAERTIYQFKHLVDAFEDRLGFSTSVKKFSFDYKRMRIDFRYGFKFFGFYDLRQIFEDIFRRDPGLRKKVMGYL